MLIMSMSVTVDGFTADRHGAFDWSVPSEQQFAFHLQETRELGAHLCGRQLYETMLVWETDPAMRDSPAQADFADVWTALPKIVFSRTLDRVEGNARLATGPLADEIAAALASTDKDVGIGGPGLAAAAIELGFVDEFRMFRNPWAVGGGTPYLPAGGERLALELQETRTFDTPSVYERYRRVAGGAALS